MRYAQAGVHPSADGMMRVRDSVRLPDADAGKDRDLERTVYIHEGPVPVRKRVLTIPRSAAAFFLGALILFFVIQIGTRLSQRAAESKSIASMEQQIARISAENQSLTLEIAECRDSSRICYKAVQELGMMSSAAVEAVPVVAPDTRPYELKTVTTAQNSPSAAGLITGSR